MPPLQSHSFVAFGIDFGTTSSAVCFRSWRLGDQAYRSPAAYDCSWSGGGQISSTFKTPTCITGTAGGGQVRWGCQLSPDEEAFRWFKLALVHPEYLGTDFQTSGALEDAQHLRRARSMPPGEVAAAYLRQLWESSLPQAAQRLCISVDELARSTLHVVIGVPANWSSDTLFRLREAVTMAGIPGTSSHPRSTVEFLSEPEAASLAVLHDNNGSAFLNDGDVITVCDCGGGTADAISYRFQSSNPLALQECVPGSSRLAGPVLFEDEFWDLLASKIKPGAAPTIRAGITKAMLRRCFPDTWEEIKTRFNEAWQDYPKPVPFQFINVANRRRRLHEEPPFFEFNHEEIRALFDLAVTKITDLVRTQVNAVVEATNELPKAVILCGGFSGSPYVRSSIEACLQQCQQSYDASQARNTIPLLHYREDRGILAVSHGCFRYAWNKHTRTPGSIRISRLAQASYGFALNHRDSGGGGSSSGFLGFIVQGESLDADVPRRVPVDLARVRFARLGSGGGGGVSLAIFRGSEFDMSRGHGSKYCDIILTGPVAAAIDTAGHLVEIAAVADRVATSMSFYVSVGGKLLEQGTDVEIRYEDTRLR